MEIQDGKIVIADVQTELDTFNTAEKSLRVEFLAAAWGITRASDEEERDCYLIKLQFLANAITDIQGNRREVESFLAACRTIEKKSQDAAKKLNPAGTSEEGLAKLKANNEMQAAKKAERIAANEALRLARIEKGKLAAVKAEALKAERESIEIGNSEEQAVKKAESEALKEALRNAKIERGNAAIAETEAFKAKREVAELEKLAADERRTAIIQQALGTGRLTEIAETDEQKIVNSQRRSGGGVVRIESGDGK